MPRGGSRKHPADCKCGHCPQIGRRKVERLTDPASAAKVLRSVEEQRLSRAIFDFELRKLGFDPKKPDYGVAQADLKGSTIALQNHLNKERDRAYGRCREYSTVNHVHDKPDEVTATISIRGTLEKALQRALSAKR